jgi:hypothetical protein
MIFLESYQSIKRVGTQFLDLFSANQMNEPMGHILLDMTLSDLADV